MIIFIQLIYTNIDVKTLEGNFITKNKFNKYQYIVHV